MDLLFTVLEAEKFKIKILPELLSVSKLSPTHDVFTKKKGKAVPSHLLIASS